MKLATPLLGLLCASLLWVSVWGYAKEPRWASAVKQPDPVAEQLVRYCDKRNEGPDPDYLRYVVGETRRLAASVGHRDKLKTLLAMWYVESRYNQAADDGDSYGIAQTRKKYEKRLRRWWGDRGVELGSMDDPTAQVAFGVAEFSEHWRYARHSKNRLWDTVRRYNGSGTAAKRHARRVFKARAAIFGE